MSAYFSKFCENTLLQSMKPVTIKAYDKRIEQLACSMGWRMPGLDCTTWRKAWNCGFMRKKFRAP